MSLARLSRYAGNHLGACMVAGRFPAVSLTIPRPYTSSDRATFYASPDHLLAARVSEYVHVHPHLHFLRTPACKEVDRTRSLPEVDDAVATFINGEEMVVAVCEAANAEMLRAMVTFNDDPRVRIMDSRVYNTYDNAVQGAKTNARNQDFRDSSAQLLARLDQVANDPEIRDAIEKLIRTNMPA